MTDKDKDRAEINKQFHELQAQMDADWHEQLQQIRELERKQWEDIRKQMQEALDNAPKGSLGELLRLIAIVQDRAPEAEEAITQLIQRHFQERRVLWQPGERGRLESSWKLELSLDQYGELKPLNYERDVAPLPLLETIEEAGDFPLLDVPKLMRKDMRNRIVNEGAQGRHLDSKEGRMEYRHKEFGDPDNTHEIRPNLSKWNDKEKLFVRADKHHNPEYNLQYTTEASPGFGPYPWEATWKVGGVTEEDRLLWESVQKMITSMDAVDQALIQSIMFKVPMALLSRETGIPQGTLRSRKFRLMTKLKENATNPQSSSVSYVRNNGSTKNRAKAQQTMDLRRPRENE